jgi:hypothetical protein
MYPSDQDGTQTSISVLAESNGQENTSASYAKSQNHDASDTQKNLQDPEV